MDIDPNVGTSTVEPTGSALRSIVPGASVVAAARQRLQAKAGVTAALFALSYVVLVFLHVHWSVRLAAAVVLVHAILATATGVMHDANHGSFSTSGRVNRLFSYSADLLGASSWLWRVNHNVAHHHWTNVEGRDGDIELAPFARLAPGQRYRPWHRYQHVYLWFLYGFLTLKWFVFGDFQSLWQRRRDLRTRSPRFGRDTALLVIGKVSHGAWALVVPSFFHPFWQVVLVYLACSWTVGFALAVIFQLAHCVDGADFVSDTPGRLVGDVGMAHQLATTVDFDHHPLLVRWYAGWILGGLDHQVEHHLAPRLPHTVYRQLARRVDEVCDERGWVRKRHRSFPAAVAAHARHLYAMGRPA